MLASSNLTGLGGDEAISNFSLSAAGTYFVRVSGANNADIAVLDTQFYGLSVSFVAVPEAGSPGILALGSTLCLTRRRKRSA